jgi:hypothetical protein
LKEALHYRYQRISLNSYVKVKPITPALFICFVGEKIYGEPVSFGTYLEFGALAAR